MYVKNKGYSLLEVIVTVAILGVISGLIITSSGLFDGRRVKACTDNIASVMDKVRAATLGKDEVTLTIYKTADDGIKAKIITKVKDVRGNPNEKSVEEDLGNYNVEVYYSSSIGDTSLQDLALRGEGGITFSFDRSSGALKSTEPSDISLLTVKKGNAAKEIKIYKETGKIQVDNN